MKTIDLFKDKNKRFIINIHIDDMPIRLNKLETEYMTLRSTGKNNEYTGIDIALVDINPKSGLVLFRVNDDDSAPTEFVIKAEDDPVIELKDDLGKEYHVFETVDQEEGDKQ